MYIHTHSALAYHRSFAKAVVNKHYNITVIAHGGVTTCVSKIQGKMKPYFLFELYAQQLKHLYLMCCGDVLERKYFDS